MVSTIGTPTQENYKGKDQECQLISRSRKEGIKWRKGVESSGWKVFGEEKYGTDVFK